jgi:hypothetical protein
MQNKPLRRTDGLITRQLDGETLIYDRRTNKAHCLNRTAALIWDRCDGQTTVDEILSSLSQEFDTAVDERVVWFALKQFDRDQLLDERPSFPPAFVDAAVSRRAMVRVLGLSTAVIALPLVTSIVAPTAVQAATCLPSGASCTSSAQCCSGLCQGSPLTCA